LFFSLCQCITLVRAGTQKHLSCVENICSIGSNHQKPRDTAMKYLPYRATTATGDIFDIDFPLHENTEDAVRVHQLLTAVLATIDDQVNVLGTTSNGDVLQALSMSVAVRARMIHSPPDILQAIVNDLTETAMAASVKAERQSPPSGYA
tara:strand:+ start:6291 stop:6737 length:447 start_codon:yes stop_codon:yes gene_type:complete